MKEDNRLARKDNLPENLNIIKKIAIKFLNQGKTVKREVNHTKCKKHTQITNIEYYFSKYFKCLIPGEAIHKRKTES